MSIESLDNNPLLGNEISIIDCTDKQKTPPRYYIKGLESDSEDEEDEIEPSDYFQSIDKPELELEIFFKQPYKRKKKEITVYKLALTEFSQYENKATCTFTSLKPSLFSYNHQGRYSKIRIVTATKNEETKVLKTYSQYILNKEETAIVSLDCSLTINCEFLTHEEEKEYLQKPEVYRRLFVDEEKTSSLETHVFKNNVQYGAVVKVIKICANFRFKREDKFTPPPVKLIKFQEYDLQILHNDVNNF